MTRTYYVNASPTDLVDLVLSPVGLDGGVNDGADGSFEWLTIDTTIPSGARQPDGRLFIPAGSPDTDGDGLPDVWEEAFFPGDLTQLNATGDKDGDGILDSLELALGTDPSKTDSDGDGLSDAVETNTGTFISATDTGTDPLKADTDGDGLTDGGEVNGSLPSNPLLVDTDGDTYSDKLEVDAGHNPSDAADTLVSNLLADSISEFSGIQGQDGWSYGYKDATSDPDAKQYDPVTGWTPFPGGSDQGAWANGTQLWAGSQWDLNTAAAGPWTELGRQNTHPNGSSPVHWTIRRWTADELTGVTPVALRWHTRKGNTGGGNGVTGRLFINGKIADEATIAFNNGVGVVRTYFANLSPGDKVDLILSPKGTDGGFADGSDGSNNSLQVDATLPDDARQPNGDIFVPATAGDSDADGLPDVWEKVYASDLTTLSGTGDNDGDGLNNAGEYARGSNPLKKDTDGDGLSDLVETGTGVYVSASDTGSSPKIVDTDGDGISDAAEVNGSPATNPNKGDSDGDGFSDPAEIAYGSDPNDASDNPFSLVIANSIGEFSGEQGREGWTTGYHIFTDDPVEGDAYDVNEGFVPFAGGEGFGPYDGVDQQWRGASWDLNTSGSGPWTTASSNSTHPNGPNSATSKENWVVRRWTASEVSQSTPVAIIWQIKKENTGCGNGVTGILLVNGTPVDTATIAFNEGNGVKRTFYLDLEPNDVVDLALSPRGTHGNDAGGFGNDWCDGSAFSYVVDTRIPANPLQPDGTRFIPGGAPKIKSTVYDAAAGKVTLTYDTKAGVSYTIESSKDLSVWNPVAGGFPSPGGVQATTVNLANPAPAYQFYRVVRN